MQKRNLIIFSLFIVSVLFIAGCQEAVGGRYNQGVSSTVDTTNFASTINLDYGRMENVGIYANPDQCRIKTSQGQSFDVKSGTLIRYNGRCYQVLTCGGFNIDTSYKSIRDVFVLAINMNEIFCAQQSKGTTVNLGDLVPTNLVTRDNF